MLGSIDLVLIASSAGIGGGSFAARTFLRCSRTLLCLRRGGHFGRIHLTAPTITTINPYRPIVYVTNTSVRLAPVAFLTKQLNVRSIAAPTTGKRNDVIVFQLHGTAATCTLTAITGIHDLFCRGRDVPTLRKSDNAAKQEQ